MKRLRDYFWIVIGLVGEWFLTLFEFIILANFPAFFILTPSLHCLVRGSLKTPEILKLNFTFFHPDDVKFCAWPMGFLSCFCLSPKCVLMSWHWPTSLFHLHKLLKDFLLYNSSRLQSTQQWQFHMVFCFCVNFLGLNGGSSCIMDIPFFDILGCQMDFFLMRKSFNFAPFPSTTLILFSQSELSWVSLAWISLASLSLRLMRNV